MEYNFDPPFFLPFQEQFSNNIDNPEPRLNDENNSLINSSYVDFDKIDEYMECPCFFCQHEDWMIRERIKNNGIGLYRSYHTGESISCKIAQSNRLIREIKSILSNENTNICREEYLHIINVYQSEINNIKQKYKDKIWDERSNILLFYDFIDNTKNINRNSIYSYMSNDLIIREVCSYLLNDI